MTWFFVGVIVGAAVVGVVWLFHARAAARGEGGMREAFAAMAAEALDANSRRLADLAAASLEGKKELIDQSVAAVGERLEKVRQLIGQVESERQKHYGQFTASLAALTGTTETLRQAMAGSKRVGAWGERMTEDVLRLAGMQEGVNYRKQSAESVEAGRPDFTFLLPNDLVVNMDVKFPLDKCLDYLAAEDDARRAARAKEFLSAVSAHVRTVAGRGYIDPAGGTVDYVIVFIPNEQVYAAALELEPALMDESLKRRVVLCGPLTLYAMLAVIRQAAENANILSTAREVLELLGKFRRQWEMYKESLGRMGERLAAAVEEYGRLQDTRTRMLERPLEKIEALRAAGEVNDNGRDAGDSGDGMK